MKEKVSVPFMLLGILFNVCLIAANLLETKVIQVGSLTVTAGLLVFPIPLQRKRIKRHLMP